MICPKCRNEISDESLFCNNCGVKLDESNVKVTCEDNTINNFIKQQDTVKENYFLDKIKNRIDNTNIKRKIIISVFLSLIIIVGVGYTLIKPPSPQKVFEKVKDYNTVDQINYIRKVYPSNGHFLGLFKHKNQKYYFKTLCLCCDNAMNNLEQTLGRSISDYNAVKIENVEIKHRSYSSDYVDINVTIKNGGSTPINYIKINLDYKDDSGKIVKSNWTNDDSLIKPGASQVLSTMMELGGWKTVKAEIDEIR